MIQRQPNSYHLIELYISILLRSGDISNAKDVIYKSEKFKTNKKQESDFFEQKI